MKTPITLKQVLLEEAEKTYATTGKLFRKVDDSELTWKPGTGKNWMSMGQLLMHCAHDGCGQAFIVFVKEDFGPVGEEMPGDQGGDHLAAAEDLTAVESVEQAINILKDDLELTRNCISEVEETDLLSKRSVAPWGGPEMCLFQHLLMMIAHLAQHKGQLFYYLKLMGKDVDTYDLWGEM